MKNYTGSDVKTGPGGYVRIGSRWLCAVETEVGIVVNCLGWGEPFAGYLSDYPPEQRELLRETLE